jgi:O-antigen ligase
MAERAMQDAVNGAHGGWLSRAAPPVAKTSFFLYLFFLFFGTSLPFAENAAALEDVAASNPINQYVFSVLYLASFLTLLPGRSRILRLIREEKFLSLFLAWSLATVFWSDFAFVSFKRWIQAFGTATVFSAALLHLESEEEALGYFKSILVLYLPLCLLSVLLVPGAVEPDGSAWRGLASQKNSLGQVSLAGLIVWTLAAREPGPWKRVAAFFFLGLSLVLLIGSRSTTSLLAGAVLLSLAGVLYAERTILRPVAGGILSSLVVLAFFLSLSLLLFLSADLTGSLLQWFGKDRTFTSRVDIWASVYEEAKRHLAFGCGFEGFWVVDNPAVKILVKDLQWLINQAHMGYLDLLNETGIVGLVLFALMGARYFHGLGMPGETHSWKWFVIAALIVNLQESTLFRLHSVNGALFVFSYLSFYARIADQRRISAHPRKGRDQEGAR